MQKTAVSIVGAGNLGRALALALERRDDIAVRMWDKDPLRVPKQGTLAEVLEGAEVVFLCVPSWVTGFALRDAAPLLPPGTIVVSMAKGIEPEQSRFMPELLDSSLPTGQPWALMGGPMLAAEIAEGQPAAGVVASPNAETALRVTALFKDTHILVESSGDVIGLALLGVLKNVYAIGLGIAEALEWEGNACGWYVSQSLRECTAIVTRAGGTTDTVLGPAGAGDLVATGFSRHSRNRTFGRALVKGAVCPTDSEGCASLPHLLKRLGPSADGHRLFQALAAVVLDRKDARTAFEELLP